MKVLITRAEPAASQTVKALQSRGYEAITSPILEIADTGIALPDTGYDDILFTSKNAVEILRKRGWQPHNSNMTAYCVGAKTKKAAENLGFSKTISANGGGAVLCDLIGEMGLQDKVFLYPSTPDKSFDMEKTLARHKIKVKTVDIYQAKTITPSKETLEGIFNKVQEGCVFVYSALSSAHLKKLIEDKNLNTQLNTITLIGISKQATQPLEGLVWKLVLVAKSPNEDAMIKLIP